MSLIVQFYKSTTDQRGPMKHIYLTADIIKDALTHHSITEKEAEELTKVMSRCDKTALTHDISKKHISLSA